MPDRYEPIRFGVVWEGAAYELFNLVADTRKPGDESIYLHTYSPSAELGMERLALNQPRRLRADIDLSSIRTTPFRADKLTFHSSGVFHWTDRTGSRVSEYDGRRGPAFAEIVDCWTLFSLYPTVPGAYRKSAIDPAAVQPVDILDHGSVREKVIAKVCMHPIQLVDIAYFGFVPLQITFYLVRRNFDFGEDARRLHARYRSLFLRVRRLLPTYELDGIVRFHKSSDESFPRHEAIGILSVEFPSRD